MKRTAPFLPLILFSFMPCTGKSQSHPLGLKGNVKKVMETQIIKYSDPGEIMEAYAMNIREYDKSGKVTSELTFPTPVRLPGNLNVQLPTDSIKMRISKSGLVIKDTSISLLRYNYNSNGQLISKEQYSDTPAHTPEMVINYEYDEEGRIKSEVSYNPRDKYAEKKRLIYLYKPGSKDYEVITYHGRDADHLEREKQLFRPDADGNIVERYYYDHETKKYWKDHSATYHDGNITECKNYYPDGTLWHGTSYEYDNNGNLKATTTTRGDGSSQQVTYSHSKPDKAGNYLHLENSNEMGSGTATMRERSIEYYD